MRRLARGNPNSQGRARNLPWRPSQQNGVMRTSPDGGVLFGTTAFAARQLFDGNGLTRAYVDTRRAIAAEVLIDHGDAVVGQCDGLTRACVHAIATTCTQFGIHYCSHNTILSIAVTFQFAATGPLP
jgi:hypothetical protein